MSEIPDEWVEKAARALSAEGADPGNGIHSWRCEHPDRYGKCDCVSQVARAVIEAVLPDVRRAARAEHDPQECDDSRCPVCIDISRRLDDLRAALEGDRHV